MVRFSFFLLGNFLPVCCHRDDVVARDFGIPLKRSWKGRSSVVLSTTELGWVSLHLAGRVDSFGFLVQDFSAQGAHCYSWAFLAMSLGCQCASAHRSWHWTGAFWHPSLLGERPDRLPGGLRENLSPHFLPLSRGSTSQPLTWALAAAIFTRALHNGTMRAWRNLACGTGKGGKTDPELFLPLWVILAAAGVVVCLSWFRFMCVYLFIYM